MIDVKADFSDIADLQRRLGVAREVPHKIRARELKAVADEAAQKARTTVSGYNTDSTGELLASITQSGTPVFQQISAEPKQARLLEYGTPNTGAPRPWLTEPAQEAIDELFERLSAMDLDL